MSNTSLGPVSPFFLAFQLEGACILQRLLERKKLLVLVGNGAGAQPVPVRLPPIVLEGFIWSGGHVGRPGTSLGPVFPFFLGFQLESACMQQRLFERQELLVFAHTNVASAQPVPIALPSAVLVYFIWAGRHVGRPDSCLAPHLPFFLAFQLECACMKQRLFERQEG